MIIGVVANADEILSPEALKAAHFLDMCGRRDIPVLFLQNSLPPTSRSTETLEQTVLKDRGKMSSMVATLNVPKITVTLSACYEDDFLLMVKLSNIISCIILRYHLRNSLFTQVHSA
jgi:3-methylcrotonyl-CoA carboxylase beta subunit